jgi:ribose transport system ATP-binding protein
MTTQVPANPVLELTNIRKRYGITQALDGATMSIAPGEIVGLIGHNGAGKSTLMRVIVGLTKPDTGTVRFDGNDVGPHYSMHDSRGLGIRIAYQELSLAPELRVYENVVLNAPAVAGWGWRKRSEKLLRSALDEIFPGNRIALRQPVHRLSLAQQQMLEITQAVLEAGDKFSLLILDEPTSALSPDQADHLFEYLKKLKSRGISTVLISHKLHEIIGHTDRVVVMRDGAVVSEQPTAQLDHDRIVAVMGGVARAAAAARPSATGGAERDREDVLVVSGVNSSHLHDLRITARAGEIVGLSGLDGQGQQQLLRYLWRHRHGSRAVRFHGGVSFVTGDRGTSGVFQLWTVGQNIGVGVLRQIAPLGVVRRDRELGVVKEWTDRLAVRGSASTPITDLSGGNQQKALIARALASTSRVVLLDDPFRGVDIETKQQVYRLMREEADTGRSFLWFTTENAELAECHRVYVMAGGRVVAELAGDEITEEAVIAASFERT